MTNKLKKPINWNRIEDPVDLDVWNKLTNNFWLDTKVALSNDIKSWDTLTPDEQDATRKVFAGLTLLDTVQGAVGSVELMKDAITPHEEAIYANISFMEMVHAKSYSSIFSTLCSTDEIDEVFRWASEDEYLLEKERIILKHYVGDDPHKKKIASTLLESFLFYSGFYLPLYWSSKGKLTNTADIIRLILRDECFVPGTQLLTTHGWVNVENLRPGVDKVLQWNPDTNTTEFTDIINYSNAVVDYTYRLKNSQGHVNQHVSPNHRVVYRDHTGAVSEKRALEYDTIKYKNSSYFMNSAPLKAHGSGLSNRDRILIMIQADGSYNDPTRRDGSRIGAVPVLFSFAKERKSTRLEQLAEAEGLRLDFRGVDATNRKNWALYVPAGDESLWPRDKKLSSIRDFSDVTIEWAQEFIDELSLWDGHQNKDNKSRIVWRTIDPENAEYVQAVATLAGYRSLLKIREDKRSDTYSDVYTVHIHRSLSSTGVQKVKQEKIPGMTVVYGVEVPSGYLVSRNNGGVSITGNSIHGYYIGYKYQKNINRLPEEVKDKYTDFTIELLLELMDNEVKYTESIYDPIGLTEDVKKFLKYNANKALMNLGYNPIYSADQTKASAAVMSALTPNSGETHDFFSGSGSSYVIGKHEDTDDDDWDF